MKGGGGTVEGSGVQVGKQGEKTAVRKAGGGIRVSKIFKTVLQPAN